MKVISIFVASNVNLILYQMKKYFYTVCCFLAATAFALTSCGDEETIINEPDVPVTPDGDGTDDTGESETSYSVMRFNLNENSESCIAGGDSIAYFTLLDELLAAVQDSLTNAESSMYIETDDNHSFALVSEDSDREEFNALGSSLRIRIQFADKPQDFVYTGYCIIEEMSIKSVENIFHGAGGLGTSFGSKSMLICIPRIKGTCWVTKTEDAAVQSIAFEAEATSMGNGAYINGNQDVPFHLIRNGAEVSLTSTDNTYVFHFNETGTELTLVSINGEEVSETYVYTVETPAE